MRSCDLAPNVNAGVGMVAPAGTPLWPARGSAILPGGFLKLSAISLRSSSVKSARSSTAVIPSCYIATLVAGGIAILVAPWKKAVVSAAERTILIWSFNFSNLKLVAQLSTWKIVSWMYSIPHLQRLYNKISAFFLRKPNWYLLWSSVGWTKKLGQIVSSNLLHRTF